MRIFAVDDEPLMLETLQRSILEAVPDAELRGFTRSRDALDALAEGEPRPDVVFSDIEMPGINGLELAVKLKTLSPETRIIFVTGFSEYAVEAYRMHVSGYMMKPVTAERIREEIDHFSGGDVALEPQKGKIQVRCFGSFEVFWQGEPLKFSRSKTKELLAYLVDRRGELCTSGELIAALWEDEGDPDTRKTYLRVLTADLQSTLSKIEMEDVLIRRKREWAIRPEMLDCDYYRMLHGDMDALNSFRGEYMSRYSWAEITAGSLTMN